MTGFPVIARNVVPSLRGILIVIARNVVPSLRGILIVIARNVVPSLQGTKQSRALICTWIASLARNDEFSCPVIARNEAIQSPDMCTWIASQARNDEFSCPVIARNEAIQSPDMHLDCFAGSQ